MNTKGDIVETFEAIGYPQDAAPLTDEQRQRFSTIFPPSLVWLFETYGIGHLFDGLFQMCDPEPFRSILAMIFKADPDFHHKNCHVVAYTAFGYLTLWSDKLGIVGIDLPDCRVSSQALAPTLFKSMPAPRQLIPHNDDRMVVSLLPFDADSAEYSDYLGAPMYRRCQEMHGRLQPGECYGFFPALAIAGRDSVFQRVENIKRVKALEHFAILAQLDTFYLTKVGPNGFEPVRPIG